jgi:hypothetical protein
MPNKKSGSEKMVDALSAMFESRGLPTLSDEERMAFEDAFFDAVEERMDERAKVLDRSWDN